MNHETVENCKNNARNVNILEIEHNFYEKVIKFFSKFFYQKFCPEVGLLNEKFSGLWISSGG